MANRLTTFGNDLYTGKRSFNFVGGRKKWYAIAGVGLKPMPFSPVPSSSGSLAGPIRWPVISLSCHVSAESGGDAGGFPGRGLEGDLAVDAGVWLSTLLKEVCGVDVASYDEMKAVGCANAAMSVTMRGRGAWGVSGTSSSRGGLIELKKAASRVTACAREVLFARAVSAVPSPSTSTSMAPSFGFLRITSSVGVSGDMGMAAVAMRVIPLSWSATAFLGLSAGAGLSRGGVAAGRMASAVLSSGICICWGCTWSRLRLGEGDGWASCIGGISPAEAFT